MQVADAKGKASVVQGDEIPWNVSINLQGLRDSLELEMTLVSKDDPTIVTKKFQLDEHSKHDIFRTDDPTAAGTEFRRMVKLPEGFTPGVVAKLSLSAPLVVVLSK